MSKSSVIKITLVSQAKPQALLPRRESAPRDEPCTIKRRVLSSTERAEMHPRGRVAFRTER